MSTDEGARDVLLARLLAWYRDMGVDTAVGDTPTDWLARGPAVPRSFSRRVAQGPAPAAGQANADRAAQKGPAPALRERPPSTPPAAPPMSGGATIVMSDDEAEAGARAAARQARSLDELRHILEGFDGCGLKATAKNLCFYRGAAQARVVVIGEAPGRDEDRAGVPFVGRAGQLLDKMLAAIELSEADTHITNVVYWRPPGNRVPTPQETLVCRPFLERQIELVQPELIITVGGSAAKLVLDTPHGIMKVRGRWQSIEIAGETGTRRVPVMPTLHPAYLLRSPAHKRHAWRDLLAIRSVLDSETSPDELRE